MLENLYGQRRVALNQAELSGIFKSQGRYAICRGGQFNRLKGANLDGLNLARQNLKAADFSGTSLVKADLSGSNLEGASLYCADLRGANLQGANLTRADMRGASFRDAVLSFSVLDDADLRAGMMMYVAPNGDSSIVSGGDFSQSPAGAEGNVDFSNCSMKSVNFGNAKLSNVIFDGALLSGAVFKGARLSGASFRGAVLTGVNLNELGASPEALKDAVLDVSPQVRAKSAELKVRISAHQAWVLSNGSQGSLAVLDGEDLRPLRAELTGRNLIGLRARNIIAIGVNFAGCQLQAAKFDGADLRDADFGNANLSGVSLKAAKLAHAKFSGAKLQNLALVSGETVRPDLSGAQAKVEQFQGAVLDDGVAFLGLTG